MTKTKIDPSARLSAARDARRKALQHLAECDCEVSAALTAVTARHVSAEDAERVCGEAEERLSRVKANGKAAERVQAEAGQRIARAKAAP